MDCFVIQYACPGEIELFSFFSPISLCSLHPLTPLHHSELYLARIPPLTGAVYAVNTYIYCTEG